MLNPAAPQLARRADLLARLEQNVAYDLAVVGGGATGLGVALDAAARGFRVVLLDSHDFAKGTSSRSTKLVHGGVRYLAQGNISLVREALHERTTLLHNAPHLAQPLAFVVPAYRRRDQFFYGVGLSLYDLLAGKAGLGRTQWLSRNATLAILPGVQAAGLCGGVKYWDGQFDDARLALALARTAAGLGALLVNYCTVNRLTYASGKVSGLECTDSLSGVAFNVRARCVINATGVWVDALREQDGPAHEAAGGHPIKPLVAPSQGVHLVVDRDFLAGDTAMMVPATSDGRVLFAVPWLGKLVLGTTDTPRYDLAREPHAFKEEIDFILNESARYLRRAPLRSDVRSVWVGLRPLVKPQDNDGNTTKRLSREHAILVSRTGLVTVTGGKWTTYRSMAEDVLEKCAETHLLDRRAGGLTTGLRLTGSAAAQGLSPVSLSHAPGMHIYGSEQAWVSALPGADVVLGCGLTEAMVRFSARYEYAVTVEDVLARRSRCLFLDAAMAIALAGDVARILQSETGLPSELDAFLASAPQYLDLPA